MEKKTFKVIGNYLLRKAFIVTLQLEGWTGVGGSTDSSIEENRNVGIYPYNGTGKEYYAMTDNIQPADTTYELPVDWDDALQAFRDWTVPVPVEPTWKIEAFNQKEGIWYRAKDNTYTTAGKAERTGSYELSRMLDGSGATVKNGTLIIQSVKATSESPTISISDWIVAECTHMGTTPMQVEGFVVNDRNNLLIKTRQFRKHGIGVENCKKVDAPVEKKQEPVAKVGEYVIHKEPGMLPDVTVQVDRVCAVSYQYTYPKGYGGEMNISECRKATQKEIDRDWKKEPVDEKVYPLIQVLLTRKQIDKLKEILK